MDEHVLALLKEAKTHYQPEGFVILGIFGSRARCDHRPDSDLDILYYLEPVFHDSYPGWNSFGRIEDIKAELATLIGLAIDLADRDALRQVGQKYILPETIYLAYVRSGAGERIIPKRGSL